MIGPYAGAGTFAVSWAAGEVATQTSGNDTFGLLIALCSTIGAVGVAYLTTRNSRRSKRERLENDDVTISRAEYDRLRALERRHGK